MRATRIAGALAIIGVGIGFGVASPASAGRAVHAGETIAVSKTSGLTDGETVRVSITHFTPNSKPVKIVIAGQTGFTTVPDKLNFTEYASAPTITVNPDGTGEADFVVKVDHGLDNTGAPLVCGQNGQQCWLTAVQEPFLPQPNYAQQEITFGGATAPTTAAAPTTVFTPTSTTAAPTTVAPTTTVKMEAAANTSDDSSNTGLYIGIAAAAVVVLGGLGFVLARRNSGDDGSVPPAPLT